MNFLIWIILGSIAGAIARALAPRRQRGGAFSTFLTGIIGAFIGGSLYCLLTTGTLALVSASLSIGGLVFAVIGAWGALFVQGLVFKGSSSQPNNSEPTVSRYSATNVAGTTRAKEPISEEQRPIDTSGREQQQRWTQEQAGSPPSTPEIPIGSREKSIFISYRRSDSIAATGRIYDYLERHFGYEHVFKDVDSIPPGVDFREYLAQAVGQCQVFITVIGSTWLNTLDEHGHRRLDHPDDFVRLEIESALKRNILVIPVLLSGAKMPQADELPEGLQGLVYRNAVQVQDDPYFRSDVNRLIRGIDRFFGGMA